MIRRCKYLAVITIVSCLTHASGLQAGDRSGRGERRSGVFAGNSVARVENYRSAARPVSFTKPVLTVELAAKEAGRIEEVFVKVGDRVTAGMLVVRLDDQIHRIHAKSARAEASDTAEVERLLVQLNSDEEHAKNVRDLIDRGAVSPEELRDAELNAELSRIALKAAKRRLEQKRLQADEADERLNRRRITTPIDGVVIDVVAKPGEFVSTTDSHLLTIVQLEKLRATFFVPATLIENTPAGTQVQLLSDAAKDIPAVVTFVSPVIQADSGLVRVDVTIDHSTGAIRAGQRVQWVGVQNHLGQNHLGRNNLGRNNLGQNHSGGMVAGEDSVAKIRGGEVRSTARMNQDGVHDER